MRIILILLTLVAAGCGATNTPTPQVVYVTPVPSLTAATPATASPSISSAPASVGPVTGPSPVITDNPSAAPVPSDKVAAGKLYLAAAGMINKASRALDRKYKTFYTVAQARAYYAKAAKLERAFTDALRKIAVPPEVAADLQSLIRKDAATEALYIEASGARTWRDVDSLVAPIERAQRAGAAAANLVREDLGLASVPR